MDTHHFSDPQPARFHRPGSLRALVLAAGKGTRLAPLTESIPKPLLPIAGRPLLELILRWLNSEGVAQVAINIHHHAAALRAAAADQPGEILFSEEVELLGTAGALRPLSGFLASTFVVVYGDVLTRVPLGPMLQQHLESDCLATIALHRHPRPWEKGVVELDQGFVRGFREKPPPEAITSDLVNAGIYILEPDILAFLPESARCDFGHDLFPELLAAGEPIAGHVLAGELLDIGTPEAYAEAQELGPRLWPELY